MSTKEKLRLQGIPAKGKRTCETLDSMELLLRLSEGEDEPIASLGELIRRTEYAEEALRHPVSED